MKIIVCENYDEMSLKGAEIVKAQVNEKPDCVLLFLEGTSSPSKPFLFRRHFSGRRNRNRTWRATPTFRHRSESSENRSVQGVRGTYR